MNADRWEGGSRSADPTARPFRRTRINPPGLYTHPAFNRVVTVEGPSRFVFVAGVVAADENFECVAPGDHDRQYRHILWQLDALLAAAGATWEDVVHRRIFTVDPDEFVRIDSDPSTRVPWSPGSAPPSTMVGVTRLSSPDFVIEIDLLAVVGTSPAAIP
jgi:enamine deaminase RidA (YjgF/YER057c/UK114 family)